MMNFTLPILFIAVLGCIYVHLEKQKSYSVTSYWYVYKSKKKCFKIFLFGWRNFIHVLIVFYTCYCCFLSYCSNKDWLKVLKKPKIIKPLGIVTWIELFFLAMFIILCVWYFSAFVYFHYSTITTYAATKGVQV